MSQPSVASFFHSRKRTAIDDIYAAKNKVTALEAQHDNLAAVTKASSHSRAGTPMECGDNNAPTATTTLSTAADVAPSAPTTRSGRRTPVPAPTPTAATTRPRRCLKPADSAAKKAAGSAATANAPQQQKIVKFTLAGHLSPKKKMQSDAARLARADCTGTSTAAVALFSERSSNVERGLKTPTKAEQKARFAADQAAEVRSKLSLDEIRARVTRSSRLSEMKASMEKLAALQEQRDRIISTRKSTMKTADKHNNADSQTDRAAKILGKSLKQFDTIELEVLSSPQKGLNTPTKQQTVPASPGGGTSNIDELMSPKKTATPRRLFSPTKTASGSPTRCAGGSPAAYERFKALRDAGRPALTLPYKYRCLAETFKCVDTVCSMFFNRPEAITMKKLCPAVKRLLRRDIGESDLGQILAVFPEAYNYKHKKMLNAGSHTKYEYYQLVLTPNVPAAGAAGAAGAATSTTSAEDNIIRAGQQQKMNPQMIIDRQQRFNQLLLERVKDEHDKFLRQLDQPIVVPKDKITSWHPKFELERCPDILPATLPQPPNVEKFSCARDILATARNLFNCATPMERVMQRVGDKLAERQRAQEELQQQQPPPQAAHHQHPTKTVGSQLSAGTDTESEPPTPTSTRTGQTTAGPSAADPVSALLKGVPKSLLERIRAKQAARELDAMTRRPSQDKEAGKYERLPELARYLRNIFVTESRNVLKIEIVLAKLENSYRERLPKDRMKELLHLIGTEVPNQWLTFPHIADVHYVKIKKDVPLGEVIAVLERRAAEMA